MLTRSLWLQPQLLQVPTEDFYKLFADYCHATAEIFAAAEADPASPAGRRMVRSSSIIPFDPSIAPADCPRLLVFAPDGCWGVLSRAQAIAARLLETPTNLPAQ